MIENELFFLQENWFSHSRVLPWEKMPPLDEPFVAAWVEYIKEAGEKGADAVLHDRFVQFYFPVRKGISDTEDYRLATKQGMDTGKMREASGTILEAPDELQVYLYQTLAGRIPVLQTGNRHDFEMLVRVLAHKNEPVTIPSSMGACLVKGFNNWDRIKKYKTKPSPELCRDRFLILTDQEYSNVAAGMLGLPEDQWRRLSLIIRREHEATHYFTLRFLGSARNHLLDELIADYMGLVVACGRYRADWFLCFLGLENYPIYRQGGRLSNYLKTMDLSGKAFTMIKEYLKNAAVTLENFSSKYGEIIYTPEGKYRMLLAMSKMNLPMLASREAEEILLRNGLHNFFTMEVKKV